MNCFKDNLQDLALKNILVPYNEAWIGKFSGEAELLKGVFGNSIIEIHHVGSTSIPDIYAKPEIDIHVEIKTVRGIEKYTQGMELLGYRVRGEEVEPKTFYFSKDENGVRTFKVHVSETNHSSLMNHLLFKNYLMKFPRVAAEYSRLKLQLAKSNKTGIMEYLNGKGPFIQEVLANAKNSICDHGN